MRHKLLVAFLIFEAAACVVLNALRASFSGLFSAVTAFPFEQLGGGLRALSLSGRAGNAAAIAIYAVFCLLPVAALVVFRKRRGAQREDGLLILLSAALFAVMYLMVNPGVIASYLGSAAVIPVGKAVLGGALYSVLCGYIVLCALRLFAQGGTDKLARYLSVLLALLAAAFVFTAFGARFGGLLDGVYSLRAANTGNEGAHTVTYIFLALQFVVDALPYVLDIFIAYRALMLLGELRRDRYGAGAVKQAWRLSRLCAAALTAAMLSNIALNLLSLLFARALLVVNGFVRIPVLSVAFALAAILLARFIAENKQLKDENDMFI
jgi:hypothetical protein